MHLMLLLSKSRGKVNKGYTVSKSVSQSVSQLSCKKGPAKFGQS